MKRQWKHNTRIYVYANLIGGFPYVYKKIEYFPFGRCHIDDPKICVQRLKTQKFSHVAKLVPKKFNIFSPEGKN